VKRLRKYVRTKIDSRKDPWAVLLAKLSGVHAPPKARQGYQQFMHECYAERIDPIVKQRWAETQGAGASVPVSKEPNAPFRAQIAREVFAALPESEKQQYSARAKAEAAAAHGAFEKSLKDPSSKAPADRQKSVFIFISIASDQVNPSYNSSINHIGSFVAPILQGIFEQTGMHSVLVLGGPVPKYGGDLRTIQYVSAA
jgi:hypothetical protein